MLYFLFFLNGILSCAENEKPLTGIPSAAEIRSQIEFIAADELMGRQPGTAGCDKAADFIAHKFRDFDLQVLPGGSNFYQTIDFINTGPPTKGNVVLSDQTFSLNENLLQITGPALHGKFQYIFLGYGATAKDFIGHSLKDKVLITKLGKADLTGSGGFRFSEEKRNLAAKLGAVALLEISPAELTWERLQYYFGRWQSKPVNATAEANIPHFYLAGDNGKLGEVLREKTSGKMTIDTPGMAKRQFQSSNILGYIPGRDARNQDEYILLCAHYDHIGTGLQKPGATLADSIFNGARDNGIGVVALLAAAQYLATNPARRPIIILALTAEETGLHGSQFFVENSPVPLEKIIFVLNSDGAGVTDESIATIIGLEKTSAAVAIRSGIKRAGLEPIVDPVPAMHLFERSDNISFAKKGIPAVTVSPGFHQFGGELTATYHQPNDDISIDFPFDYLRKFSTAFAFAARAIADLEERPIWCKGEKYEQAARRLYQR